MIMGILFLILVIVVMGLIWSLPLYLVVNLVLWLFHIPFHLTWLQALGVCLLASVVKGLLGKGE
jgi:hypothetical protein